MDLLRPYLLPLTHNLPHPLPTLGAHLLTPTCYNQLILNLDLSPQPPCLRLAISKLLGLGIITLSSIVKIPQILNLLSTRSAQGVSLLSYTLETGSYLVTLLYAGRRGYPFTAYGETALIAVQNLVVCVLVLLYGGKGIGAATGFVAGVVAMGMVVGDERWVDMRMLGWLQAGAGLVGVASKVPQIWVNWREGGTGVLSAFTVFTYLAGSLSRIFTTLQEVDDKLILYGFIAGFALNAVLAAQMVYYWRSSPATAEQGDAYSEKPKKEIAMGSSTGASTKGKGPSTRRRG
ncbi:MAG: hypothetical protein LQ339_000451 [Xanthoria mediterranea]|nr:MAG: hypothetical protein LQ339_000451 [Xanthoria mediterranea]